jgi:serine/threonine protein kinase
MRWPLIADYKRAAQNPVRCFDDPELRRGEVKKDRNKLPVTWRGSYGVVFKVHDPEKNQNWAVKCFLHENTSRAQRYQAISDHLQSVNLKFMVPFVFLQTGIRVDGNWFPAVKMQWVEGIRLNELIDHYLDRPDIIERLAEMWLKLAQDLRQARISHGDLQHGNVLLIPSGDQKVSLKLIDYDGMWVPALTGYPAAEIGFPGYQHPQRFRENIYHERMDSFSHLVIYSSLQVLGQLGRSCWDAVPRNGDNLLFDPEDLERPRESKRFLHILQQDAPFVPWVNELVLAAEGPLDAVPSLIDLGLEIRPIKFPDNHVEGGVASLRTNALGTEARWKEEQPTSAELRKGQPAAPTQDTLSGDISGKEDGMPDVTALLLLLASTKRFFGP